MKIGRRITMKIPKIVAGVLLALSIIATGCGNVKEEENKVEEKQKCRMSLQRKMKRKKK